MLTACSKDSKIASVMGNVDNKCDGAYWRLTRTDELVIEGRSKGETMVTIRVTEPGELGQWAEQTILVRVTEN